MDKIQQFRKRSRANTEVGKFFTTVEQLRILVQDLQKGVENLKTKHVEIIQIPISNDNRTLQLEEIDSKIKSLSQIIRAKLKAVEKGIAEVEKAENKRDTILEMENASVFSVSEAPEMDDAETKRKGSTSTTSTTARYTPATLRIRKVQYQSLAQQFREIMAEYQLAQVSYRDQLKTKLKRQLKIMDDKKTVSEGEIEDMIDNGKVTLFTKSIIVEPKIAEDIQSRHNDLMKLEKSIKELSELFKEMAIQVEMQGDVVDSIENSVEKTAEFTEESRKLLKEAKEYQQKYRKKSILLIAGGGVAVTIIVLVLTLTIIFSIP